ncbi:xanthine dehydrogenase family protein molybdopterin-binding subunit [soil metagenome]
MSVSAPTRRPPDATSQVGRSMPRVDAAEKLRGDAVYVGDMTLPGMLHGKVLRSPLPHARIRTIDTAAAAAIPGVVAILTGADLLDIDPHFGRAIQDRPIVAIDRVRHVGEPVAAVAATDEAAAEAAVRAIAVDYEELPVAGTLAEALSPGAPLVHEGPIHPGLFHGLTLAKEREGNVCYRYAIDDGDAEAAFAGADIVIEGDYDFGGVYQYAMETHSVLAQADVSGITLWATCQHPFLVRAEISDLFGVPLSRVRVIVPYMGGGFGSKSYTKMEPITVALARKAERPVRIVNRVDESMATTRRHGARIRMRTAADAAGNLLARDVEVDFDTGAYADNGPRVVATGGDAAPGPYRWSAVRVRAACVHTHTPPSGSYRAFGASHLQWVGEMQVDEVARRAGLDAIEIRRRNLLRPGEVVRRGGKPLDADLVGDVEKAAAALGWDEPLAPDHGRGISVGLLAAGAHPVSSAIVRLEADGEAVVLVGSTEMGQGQRTAFAQIAAETLAMPAERVRCLGTDTQFTPYDRSTGASRSTTLAGLAVQRAAQAVRDDLDEIAASIWPAAEEGIEMRDGAAWFGEESRTYPQLIAKRFGLSGGQLIGEGGVHPAGTGSYAEGPVFWEICIAAVEVAIDRETGKVSVERTATIADVGRAINPQLIERQDEGATMQGIGNALFEELRYVDGLPVNDNLLEYRVPSMEDLPGRSSCIIVENADGPGPFGAKGCGEGAFAGVIGAIATAVASTGMKVDTLPLTPERVWRSINQNVEEGSA